MKESMADNRPDDYGLVAHVDELVRQRPPQAVSGFAPGGPVRTHLAGTYRSGFRGRGMEFAESRAYQPGDDIRAIDWRVTARSGKVHTKLFHEERERPVLVVVDSRAMMRFGSRDCFKSVLAARAAAVLAWVAVDGGDRIGAVLLGSDGIQTLPPQRARSRLLRLLQQVASATAVGIHVPAPVSDEPTLAMALKRVSLMARPGSLVFVLSDFADLDPAAVTELRRLATHHAVTNLLIHDALEQVPPPRGQFAVSDGQAFAVFDSDDRSRHDAYSRAFARRYAQLEQLCRQHGMAFQSLCTGDDVQQILKLPARSGVAGS